MGNKALLVGIRYASLEGHVLESTYQDVEQLREFLINSVGFQSTDIMELRDDVEPSDPLYPSNANLVKAMEDLVSDVQPGDHLVFHFSGHGSQKPDLNGDEDDKMDEAIWPADVILVEGDDADNVILDDNIKSILVDNVPDGASLVIILDCCHSGTGAGNYTDPDDEDDGQAHPLPRRKLAFRKLTKTGNSDANPVVVSWAACPDPKATLSFSRSGGYFLEAFVEAFNENPGATHQELLHCVRMKMTQSAESFLEEQRPSMTKGRWKRIQNWWKTEQPEPVLGVLYDEDGVLCSPVVDTFGDGAAS
ncbi:uncharacterized protein PHACADRAFT_206970 [Phanerochaete carnosa HHB-10118-sp]|uniref:Peptidase C14 caspase domain-containing protein n=1 Tax=Phanerochaete carnosa (strain HHB-10118-sp) TaxID=650164 RepID=K5W2M8_PHACS|nr:uncharacterized protein PHACADRAFT_206970 [Phanerochaete carnosa HHB-10118-sp]EKM58133.1 hypothetical protein PHACADRAFT_206970 [Phanerochaete carnosa HHB-10118-sp]